MIKLKTARALQIIREKRITMPGQFARLLWPDSDAWHHHVNSGRGVVKGRGMTKAGGSFIGKLRHRGLIEGLCTERSPLRLSETGKTELEEFELMQRLSEGRKDCEVKVL